MGLSLRGPVDPDAPKTFNYRAVSPSGGRINGRMNAMHEDDVARELAQDGWIPVHVSEAGTLDMNIDLSALLGGGQVKFKFSESATFIRQLHQLLKAGLSIPLAIETLGEEADPKVTAMCNDIAEKVGSGIPLSEAFAAYPKAFSDIVVAYVSAGETSGEMVETLARLSKLLEKRSQLQLKLKGVTAYPKVVGGVIGLVVIGILWKLVPRYAQIYAGFNAELPRPTQILIDVSNKLPYIALVTAAVILGIIMFLRSQSENLELWTRLDKIRFKLPIFGGLAHKMSLFRWCSTMAGALASGVTMSNTLNLAARAAGARWYEGIEPMLQETIRTGNMLHEGLQEHTDLFPPSVRALVSTGAKTGEQAEMLESAAQALDDEIDSVVAGLGAKIEVALLLVLGVTVGGLLCVLYLPILKLASTVQNSAGG